MNSIRRLTSIIVAIACSSSFACGVIDTRNGSARHDAGAENTGGSNGGNGRPPCPDYFCINSLQLLHIDVTSSVDGGVINDVTLSILSHVPNALSCESLSTTEASCNPDLYSDGTYEMAISAPGFQLAAFTASVTTAFPVCGCGTSAIVPSAVSLEPLAPVDVRSLFGASVPTCASGYEHANICCHGAPYEATTCTEDLKNPFGDCPSGQFAYPDPKACCALNSPNDCVQGPIADASDAGEPNSCINPCPPGSYPDAQDLSLCHFGLEGVQSQTAPPPFCGNCSGPPPGYCTTPCPQGWEKPAEQNDLCCQWPPGERRLCYSQSSHIGAGYTGGGGSSDGTSFVGESFFNDGNSYVTKCDFTTSSCQCLVNGKVVATPSASQFDVNLSDLCPFPITQ